MRNPNKKEKLVGPERDECDRLKAIYERKKKSLGLTQETLGEMLGMSQSAVNQYLNAYNPLNLRAAAAFSKILKVEIKEFSQRLAKEQIAVSAGAATNAVTESSAPYGPSSESHVEATRKFSGLIAGLSQEDIEYLLESTAAYVKRVKK